MDNKLKVLAVIPARGGSKGIPNKNIKNLLGQPLISYSITEAHKSIYIDRVVVSTDSLLISEVSKNFGADVVIRPENISGDKSSSEEALLHTLNELKMLENYIPDIILFIQCTSPLTISEDMDGLLQKLIEENADSALSVSKFYHFIWKNNNGNAIGINHEKSIRPMRQDRESQFLENGAIYAFKYKGFIENKYRFFGKTVFYEMPQRRNLEIDEPFDFLLAESILTNIRVQHASKKLPNKIDLIVMDFDGVFTDNNVYVLEDGREAVKCSRGDGMGLGLLKNKGFNMLVFSTEKNPVVTARCKKLGIEVIQDVTNKLPALSKVLVERDVSIENVVYIGNDINDLECIIAVGCGIAVNDAVIQVKRNADIILQSNGGNGALRELAELIIDNKI